MIESFSNVLASAGPRPLPSEGPKKNANATRFANAMATYVADGLRPHFPGILPDSSGKRIEWPSQAIRGLKKLDVDFSTPQAGLCLGISLKSVHTRGKTHLRHHESVSGSF